MLLRKDAICMLDDKGKNTHTHTHRICNTYCFSMIYKRDSVAGSSTSMGLNGVVLVIPKDRLESLSWDPVWVPGLNFLPLIELNPGL